MLQIQTQNYAVDICSQGPACFKINQLTRLRKRYLLNIPCDFWEKTSLYICPTYGFADIKTQNTYRELGFDSSALNEAKVNYASYNTKAP